MASIFISAGEISGDLHGAALVKAVKAADPTLSFWGMGHTQMRDAGVEIVADIATSSTIGIIEPIRYLPKIFKTYFKMKRMMAERKPDLLVVIDYQGYHMLLARAAKKMGIPLVYYIAPQEWQWGSEKGGRKVIEVTDKILSIFPQEEAFYQRLGGDAVYVGHPILDLARPTVSDQDFYAQTGLSPNKPILSIFPGSRSQELELTFPVLLGAAANIVKQVDVQLVISAASDALRPRIQVAIDQQGLHDEAMLYKGVSVDLISRTHLSLATSGTVTLEHAVLQTPCIANYKFGPVSYFIGNLLIGKKFREMGFFALPNLIMRRLVMPEIFQDNCTVDAVTQAALKVLKDPAEYDRLKADLRSVREALGTPGVLGRAANEIVEMLEVKSK